MQIINALSDATYGWQNHPAVKMWRGYIPALALYTKEMCFEWMSRGYKDTILERILHHTNLERIDLPPWLNREDVINSHRSNLLRKDPDWYKQYEWDAPNDLPYVWPV